MRTKTRLGLAALLCLTACASPRTLLPKETARLKAIELDPDLEPEQLRERIRERYERRVAGTIARIDLLHCSSSTLTDVFDASSLAAAYMTARQPLQTASAAAEEMAHQGLLDEKRVVMLQKVLLDHADLDEARALATRFPAFKLQSIPSVRGAEAPSFGEPRLLLPSADAQVLDTEPADSMKGPRIVAVSNPSCGPSHRAIDALRNDPQIGPLLARYGRLIVPVGYSINARALADWNARHQELRYRYVYDPGEWKGMHFEETPRFYFLKDGVILADVDGWPRPQGRRAEFITGLKAIGLWPAP